MRRARIIGTGTYLPERVVTNDEISQRVETSDEWIRTRTGIRERRVMAEGQVTSDMVAEAGRSALAAAGLQPSDLDLIVVATVTADMPMPSCAAIAQHKLGARCPAFDIAAACAGFSYGLSVVNGMIASGQADKVLLVGAEALSRFLDWDDRGTCVLFGDAAGAVVCVGDDSEPPRGVLATTIAANGDLSGDLNILGGGTLHPPSAESVEKNLHVLRMNGPVIFVHAVRNMVDACIAVMKKAGIAPEDVDVILPHQANLRIVDAIVRRLGADEDKVVVNLHRYGNTSAASIPIALDEALAEGRIKDGSVVLMCGMGAGLTWGAGLMRW